MQVPPLAFEAIGTTWRIDLLQDVSPEQRDQLMRAILARIDVFDRDYSRFREDSLVTEMARKAGTYVLPDDAEPMMAIYRKLYDLTDGRFTPLIGQVMVDAGYDAKYSFKPTPLTRPPRWEDALSYRHPQLEVKQPVWLDFGSAGKGYLIDIVAEVIRGHGIDSYCVDAGQDILHRSADGSKRRVGLEHPSDFSKVIGVVELGNESICGSAGNRRNWADYHHIIDPRTLLSPRHMLSAWVVAKTAMVADALATALFLVEPEKLAPHFDFEFLTLYPDMGARFSQGFKAEIFS
jgi:thiamine biosynthesis lipoprotein